MLLLSHPLRRLAIKFDAIGFLWYGCSAVHQNVMGSLGGVQRVLCRSSVFPVLLSLVKGG
jgi:hypothetical protein